LSNPIRGRTPVCDVELRNYANAVGRLRAARRALDTTEISIRQSNRRINRRLEAEEERRRRRSPITVEDLLESGIPNGGFGQPGVPVGAQAAYQAGEFVREASELLAEDRDYQQLRRAHGRKAQLEREIAKLEGHIPEIRSRLDANGCRYNRALQD
jgi:septal ring factor EnvC (AmiA/AmiB activator)